MTNITHTPPDQVQADQMPSDTNQAVSMQPVSRLSQSKRTGLHLVLLSVMMLGQGMLGDWLLTPLAAQEQRARVSPVMEIEVIDPRRDARGNPAVDIRIDEQGNQQVEIAPSLIVHRYYYTGDRSFRGPDLPGGPSIIVAKNPRDGQQVYLPVQMLPGSPTVHYKSRSIEYDFGDHTVIVTFPHVGDPVVSYRNGRPLNQRVGNAMGVGVVTAGWKKTSGALAHMRDGTKTMADAMHNVAGGVMKPLTLPAQNLGRLIPGAAALSDPQLKARIAEEKALRQRDAQLSQAQQRQALNDVDIPRSVP
ncbi:MAG: hypothetical protein IT423_00785 [Pirellulaceae bacterium]|nr:hypothetical protein [Pirellulaceae bacterium]